jgi:hypothetical protein
MGETMGMFRKKPVIIEAREFTPHADFNDLVAWCGGRADEVPHVNGLSYPVIDIPTLEGTMTARIGDWIIRGVSGEFYPCKPDIFKQTYEPAEPT